MKEEIYNKEFYDGDNYFDFLKGIIKKRDENPEAYELVKQTVKLKIRKDILNDTNWFSKIKKIANEKNEPVDSVLKRHVDYTYLIEYGKILNN
ncbi:MAG: hypothetical protein U5L09_04055 [Bacteroidales bacterium]|nr:hypothetical protein [Bacteroidales bacterium]